MKREQPWQVPAYESIRRLSDPVPRSATVSFHRQKAN